MTLTDFLLARYAEDEAVAKAAIDPQRPGTHWQWVTNDDDRVVSAPTWEDGSVSLRTVEEFPMQHVGPLPAFALNAVEADEPRALPHIARHDPARVLAECEAKRRIVAEHKIIEPRFNIVWRDGCCETCTAWGEYGGPNEDGTPNPCPTLRLLALPYADHPDYQEAWKP